MRRVPKQATNRAREMRDNPTEAEFRLWQLLSPYRPRFTRQLYVEPYYLDLACRRAKLGIELDGGQHHDQIAYDEQRTMALEAQGWRVVRLWNSDVSSNPEGAAEYVVQQVAEGLGDAPLPKRKGRKRTPRRG